MKKQLYLVNWSYSTDFQRACVVNAETGQQAMKIACAKHLPGYKHVNCNGISGEDSEDDLFVPSNWTDKELHNALQMGDRDEQILVVSVMPTEILE